MATERVAVVERCSPGGCPHSRLVTTTGDDNDFWFLCLKMDRIIRDSDHYPNDGIPDFCPLEERAK